MSAIAEIIRDLLLFTLLLGGLLITSLVLVSKLPDENPLKRLLNALSARLSVTLAAGIVALPIQPIPVVDGLYDIGMPVFLLYYWFTFLCEAVRIGREAARPAAPRPQPAYNAEASAPVLRLHRN